MSVYHRSALASFEDFLPARLNPLKVERVSNIEYRFPDSDWNQQLNRLRELYFRGAIVGPQGSGKSTLLRQLDTRLQAENLDTHFVFVPNPLEDLHCDFDLKTALRDLAAATKDGKIGLLDGIERLSFFQRRRLLVDTQLHKLVLTVHNECSVPTWIRCQTDQLLMEDILRDLGFDQVPIVAAGNTAFEKHAGNIRLALRELYDQFASGQYNSILSRNQKTLQVE